MSREGLVTFAVVLVLNAGFWLFIYPAVLHWMGWF